MRRVIGLVAVSAFCAGIPFASGCARPAVAMGKPQVVGTQPATVKELSRASAPVALHGVMVEKCPVSACWFRLQDDTGTVRVDVRSAGFTVTDIPQGATVTVWGKPTKDTEPGLTAQGLQYQK